MPESFKTQRYEDRPSSKIGIGGYLTEHLPTALAPFVGYGLGALVRKFGRLPIPVDQWGLGIGGMYSAFRLWGDNTKQQIEVDQVAKTVENLRGIESANQHLVKENEQLRQQIKFTERHAARAATHAEQVTSEKAQAAHEGNVR